MPLLQIGQDGIKLYILIDNNGCFSLGNQWSKSGLVIGVTSSDFIVKAYILLQYTQVLVPILRASSYATGLFLEIRPS